MITQKCKQLSQYAAHIRRSASNIYQFCKLDPSALSEVSIMFIARIDTAEANTIHSLETMIERLSIKEKDVFMVFQENRISIALMKKMPWNRKWAKVEQYCKSLQSSLVNYYQLVHSKFSNMLELFHSCNQCRGSFVSETATIFWVALREPFSG